MTDYKCHSSIIISNQITGLESCENLLCNKWNGHYSTRIDDAVNQSDDDYFWAYQCIVKY